MIRGAIFDVDGTLLDSMAIWEEAAARYLKKLGIEPDENLSQILAPMTVEEGARYVCEQYPVREEPEQIAEGVLNIVQDFYFFEAALKPGAAKFLGALSEKGIPMAVATSSDRRLVEGALKRLKIERHFQEIFTCSEVGLGKTKPLIYQMASEKLGSRAEDTYVFEDALYAAETAHGAGFRTVGVYDRFSEKDREQMEKLTDIYLMDFTDFTQFWRKMSDLDGLN